MGRVTRVLLVRFISNCIPLLNALLILIWDAAAPALVSDWQATATVRRVTSALKRTKIDRVLYEIYNINLIKKMKKLKKSQDKQ